MFCGVAVFSVLGVEISTLETTRVEISYKFPPNCHPPIFWCEKFSSLCVCVFSFFWFPIRGSGTQIHTATNSLRVTLMVALMVTLKVFLSLSHGNSQGVSQSNSQSISLFFSLMVTLMVSLSLSRYPKHTSTSTQPLPHNPHLSHKLLLHNRPTHPNATKSATMIQRTNQECKASAIFFHGS